MAEQKQECYDRGRRHVYIEKPQICKRTADLTKAEEDLLLEQVFDSATKNTS